jgi:AcrR family transcriptional regulator
MSAKPRNGAARNSGRKRRDYIDNATARSQILQTAAELFTQQGFHATSVREIGDNLGIGQSSLYYHAKNKAQILVDISSDLMDGLVEEIEEIGRSDEAGRDKLTLIIRSLLRKIEEQQAAVTVVLHERRSMPPRAAAALQKKRDRIDAIIDAALRQGFADGTIRKVPVALTRLAITGMANWAYTWFDPSGSLTADQIAEHFIDLIVRGLNPPQSK